MRAVDGRVTGKNHFGERRGFQNSISPIEPGRIDQNKLLCAASLNFFVNSVEDVSKQRTEQERDVHVHFSLHVLEISEQVSIEDETVLLFHEKPRGISTTIM